MAAIGVLAWQSGVQQGWVLTWGCLIVIWSLWLFTHVLASVVGLVVMWQLWWVTGCSLAPSVPHIFHLAPWDGWWEVVETGVVGGGVEWNGSCY